MPAVVVATHTNDDCGYSPSATTCVLPLDWQVSQVLIAIRPNWHEQQAEARYGRQPRTTRACASPGTPQAADKSRRLALHHQRRVSNVAATKKWAVLIASNAGSWRFRTTDTSFQNRRAIDPPRCRHLTQSTDGPLVTSRLRQRCAKCFNSSTISSSGCQPDLKKSVLR